MSTVFISDLHLSQHSAQVLGHLGEVLRTQVKGADALYVLGDLFEIWLGDDAMTADHRAVLDGFRRISDSGTPVYFMRGNRDFLIGPAFVEASGMTILDDPCVVELYGTRTLLMHGDLLCTDDTDYLKFRLQVRDPAWQKYFLSLSIPERIQLGKDARAASQEAGGKKSNEIMDANLATVAHYMSEHGVQRLIHGHTHRPKVHQLTLGNVPAERIVLGDWHDFSSVLVMNEQGYRLNDPRVATSPS